VIPAFYAVLAVLSWAVGVLGFVAVRALRDDRTARSLDQQFLLGVLREHKATSVVEAAHAEAIRDEALATEVEHTAQGFAASLTERDQARLEGWSTEAAEGRAAMMAVGLDPDDDDAVHAFNKRNGA